MRRLTAYLARMFAIDALILFGVVCFLLWLVNCLKAFDVVSVKGQDLLTLGYQGLLTMPPLVLVFFYVCIGIGMARALQALQSNHELHIIHTSHGLSGLWRATVVVACIGTVCALLLSNFIEPWSRQKLQVLNAAVAADLVSSTLKPKRFMQVTPGVVLLIGGRSGSGEITEFFADDRRDPLNRRTYIAKSAKVAASGDDYVLQLRDGSLQYLDENGRFSEISFTRYDLGVERIAEEAVAPNSLRQLDTPALIARAAEQGWTPDIVLRFAERQTEGLRVIGICLLVLALAGFPSGKRTRIAVPLEVVVLGLAFVERGIGSYSPLGPTTGSLLMIIAAIIIIIAKAKPGLIPIPSFGTRRRALA